MPRRLLQTGATHAQLFVDTCFVMSGLLVSLLELAKNHAQVSSVAGKQHHDRPNLMAAMVHRYVRSVPAPARPCPPLPGSIWSLRLRRSQIPAGCLRVQNCDDVING